jgi:hypothetical protein
LPGSSESLTSNCLPRTELVLVRGATAAMILMTNSQWPISNLKIKVFET